MPHNPSSEQNICSSIRAQCGEDDVLIVCNSGFKNWRNTLRLFIIVCINILLGWKGYTSKALVADKTNADVSSLSPTVRISFNLSSEQGRIRSDMSIWARQRDCRSSNSTFPRRQGAPQRIRWAPKAMRLDMSRFLLPCPAFPISEPRFTSLSAPKKLDPDRFRRIKSIDLRRLWEISALYFSEKKRLSHQSAESLHRCLYHDIRPWRKKVLWRHIW